MARPHLFRRLVWLRGSVFPMTGTLFFCASCVTAPAPVACPRAKPDERVASIFYATDRAEENVKGMLEFGRARTDPPGLYMGWERVAIGSQHRLGRVDKPIVITPAHAQTSSPGGGKAGALWRSDAQIAAFVENQLRPAIRAARPPENAKRRQVIVFIHGYNTTFDEAVRNTAQLDADLDLLTCSGEMRGVALAYSWPAQGTLLSYLADEENAEWTQQRLAPLLQALSRVCREENADLNLIAHSMGARALVRSLSHLATVCQEQGRSEKLADDVVLLAPNIGTGLFDQYVDRFLPLVRHLTIYVSAKDRALGLSTLLHGGHGRLGLIESTVLAALEITGLHREDHRQLGAVTTDEPAGKVDMIDVTGSIVGEFGHSYEDPAFIRDLRELILHDVPAGTAGRSDLIGRELQPGLFRNVRMLSYFQLRTM